MGSSALLMTDLLFDGRTCSTGGGIPVLVVVVVEN
jgi:hypothetical protein